MANKATDQHMSDNRGAPGTDEERRREQAQKAGEHSHSGTTGSKEPARGGGGNFANDPQRAADAGRKGGEHSHGGRS